MLTNKECLGLIEKARACAADPESAYLLRTRIKRAILSATRLAAASAGNCPPKFAAPVEMVTESKEAHEVFDACNHLIVVTKEMCQPSEALDCRWRQRLSEVLEGLKRLELALVKFESLGHGPRG